MRHGEVAKKILLGVGAAVAIGGLTLALATAPGLGLVVKSFASWYKNQDRYGRYRIRKTFAKLRRERLIEFTDEGDGQAKIVLTEAGKKRVLRYQLEDLKIEKPKRWDKKWRMVIFDIPERHKIARNALREKLEELDFYPLQKSVWVYPYPCRNEIDFVTECFEVSPYVRLAEVASFDGEAEARRKFDL